MKVIDPLGSAWGVMVKQLFQPFSFKHWFVLAFSAFLASFLTGEGGNTNFPSGGSNFSDKKQNTSALIELMPTLRADAGQALSTLQPSSITSLSSGLIHPMLGAAIPTPNGLSLEVWIAIIAGILVVAFAFLLLFLWLGCRGQFMLIDNVVKGTALVKAPWREFRTQANSFFGFYLIVSSLCLLLLLVFGGLAFGAYVLIPSTGRTVVHFIPLVLIAMIGVTLLVALSIAMFFVREFGMLWMYRNGGTPWEATRKVLALGAQYPIDFLLYLVIRIVMAISFFIIGLLAGCMTCCIGLLPYLGAVLILPLTVFRTAYMIDCFAQLGPDCDVRASTTPPSSEPPPFTPVIF